MYRSMRLALRDNSSSSWIFVNALNSSIRAVLDHILKRLIYEASTIAPRRDPEALRVTHMHIL